MNESQHDSCDIFESFIMDEDSARAESVLNDPPVMHVPLHELTAEHINCLDPFR